MRMPSTGWTTKIMPGIDQAGHLVIDRFSRLGSAYRETEVERDPETMIADLTSGQFDDPIHITAFNKLSVGLRTR